MFSIPVFIYEPNASFGMANRLLAYFAEKAFLGLREPVDKNEVKAGVPLRERVTLNDDDKARACEALGIDREVKTFLAFGGSQGAVFINDVFMGAVRLLRGDNYKFQVIHVAGNKDYRRIANAYKIVGFKALVYRFYEDMALLYKAADLIVCRSGASTIAELCFFGRPAVLIPYPYAYGHQEKNSLYLCRRKAALCRQQDFLNKQSLYKVLKQALDDFSGFSSLGRAAKDQKVWRYKEDFAKLILKHI